MALIWNLWGWIIIQVPAANLALFWSLNLEAPFSVYHICSLLLVRKICWRNWAFIISVQSCNPDSPMYLSNSLGLRNSILPCCTTFSATKFSCIPWPYVAVSFFLCQARTNYRLHDKYFLVLVKSRLLSYHDCFLISYLIYVTRLLVLNGKI